MTDPVSIISTGLFSNALSAVISLLGILLIAGAIIGAAWYVKYIRQFDIKVEIISTRANIGGIDQYKIIFDKGGIIYDKTDKIYYFRIKGMKIDLPSPPFNVLIPTDKGNMVKIWQKSAEEFVFLLPDKVGGVVIRQDGREYSSAELKTKQVEGDVAYWNILRKEKNKGLFNPESILMRLLPFIVPMLMFVLVIFLSWMVIKNFEVLKDVANSLLETAKVLKGQTIASSGSVVGTTTPA
jgi:hypothetical protein